MWLGLRGTVRYSTSWRRRRPAAALSGTWERTSPSSRYVTACLMWDYSSLLSVLGSDWVLEDCAPLHGHLNHNNLLAGIGSLRTVLHLMDISITIISWLGLGLEKAWGTVNKISYDLSYNCVKFIERSTYDSDLQRAKISLGNIVSKYTTLAPTILRFCKWIICKKSPAFCVRCFVN